MAKLNPAGTQFEFVTYLGGSEDDMGSGVAEDNGSTLVSLSSRSLEAPVTFDAFQTSNAGEADSIVARISAGEPSPTIATILSASGVQLVAPGSIASGFAAVVAGGTLAATAQPLPTELLGVSLRVTDSAGVARVSPLFVVTPNQVNYFVDEATASGLALVEVLQDGQVVVSGAVQIAAVSPGIFTANANGQGVPAALFLRFQGGTQTTQEFTFDPDQSLGEREPLLLDLGGENESAYVAIFGTGMRNGTTVTGKLGGQDIPVTEIFVAQGFVGLDQANIGPIPRSFIGRGVVPLIISVDGRPTNAVLLRF